MSRIKLIVLLTVLLLIFVGATESFADISNSAVLYLRIAPGARAAGMGEAYVAIADDATATHWNPAGLGAYPLSDSWQEASVPSQYRPLLDVAPVKARGGGNFEAFDIWTMTPSGLVRYDNKNWFEYEVFDTKTDRTLQDYVRSYLRIDNEERLNTVIKNVARANNEQELSYLEGLRDSVIAHLPADYGDVDGIKSRFDTLINAYDQLLIDWSRVKEAADRFKDGMDNGSLSETEADRINFAIERAKRRFLPEELRIHYAHIFDADLTSIASTENYLLVGSENGLYAYNGRNWNLLTTTDGLPSMNITTLYSAGDAILVGTDSGLVNYAGQTVVLVGDSASTLTGVISAIGGYGSSIWAVSDNQLYFFNGSAWSNTLTYTITADDTLEKIAEKFSLYDTEEEIAYFLSRISELNTGGAKRPLPKAEEAPAADSAAASASDMDTHSETDEAPVPDSATASAPDVNVSSEVVEPTDGELRIEPGMQIEVPYVSQLKGKVTSIHAVGDSAFWLGTEYGIAYFDGNSWEVPGYRDHIVVEGQTLDSIVALAPEEVRNDTYRQALVDINNLEDGTVTAGQTIRIYRNPTACAVNDISSRRGVMIFATEHGLIQSRSGNWGRVDVKGMDRANVITAQSLGSELWFVSDQRLVVKANGRTDISMMYVKWLPELADDLYYAFFSAVTNKEGWGTFGGNVTFISYGTIQRTGEQGNSLGTFDSFDLAVTGSYGTSLTSSISGGLSFKFLYSKLADQGAGVEKGKGTSSGFAVDFGFLYRMSRRMTLGLAITNLGPDMAYIDAAQADPLPRNLAFGFAFKLLQTEYYHFLITGEMNKSLVGVDDGFSQELKETVFNGGLEFDYNELIAGRVGYIYDQEGDVKALTFGAGLRPIDNIKFDFSYIPSSTDSPLANTLRMSLSILP